MRVALAGDFPFFFGVNHQDLRVFQELDLLPDFFAQRRAVLADTARKYQGVHAAENGGHRTDLTA